MTNPSLERYKSAVLQILARRIALSERGITGAKSPQQKNAHTLQKWALQNARDEIKELRFEE